MPTPTLRQIAALAGCSHVTVALALRNHPRISEATRKKILGIARGAGYQRDPVVSTLMTHLRTARRNRVAEKIAWLNWWDTADGWKTGRRDTKSFKGACRRAEELGYGIEEFWAKEPGLTARRLSKILYTRGIRGVIVGSLPRPLGHASLDWKHFAAVATGYTVVKPDFNRVIHSQFQGMTLALRLLRRRGYGRIGFTALVDQSERVNQGWLAAYLLESYRLPKKDQIPPLILPEWESGPIAKWVERYRLDAVVSNMDDVLQLLRDLGMKVPGDIGFASLDRMCDTDPYAGIDQLRGEMGAAAIDLLVSMIESNQYGLPKHPKILHFDGVWRDGPTLRPVLRTK